ncbi:hemerythrin domain-containing protein [Schlegelella sp. S2-27]|uniref:Hemerythrin domain-containing protein n=1 Tax=Caldimonas mangrovi TaxID=2944811 RepID=A0ABT0YXJ7_9BURK|nr:hemerythrin domain-containing protein [Caldimonas mangrovi]MCM5682563.1 hemerythrin domain-containing protein [Caldimonas mangrovi]
MLPGFSSPAASFEQPFEMLAACHDRVRRSLRRLQRLAGYLREHGSDEPARQAATDVLRYFDIAAPHHHEDEERHLFPVLLAHGSAPLRAAVQRLQHDHAEMSTAWAALRPALQRIADGTAGGLAPDDEGRIGHFVSLYGDHLRIEDEEVYPAAKEHLDTPGLAQIGAEMAQRRGAAFPRPAGVSGARD